MQRITGADEPPWPDRRSAPSPVGRRRRRWVVALLVVALAVGGGAVWVHERQASGPATMGCANFENIMVDLAPSSGFATQAEALHAVLATPPAAHLPHSGYTAPTDADLRAAVAAGRRGGDMTPTVLMPNYWHRSGGKVDVQIFLAKMGSGTWTVSGVSACR